MRPADWTHLDEVRRDALLEAGYAPGRWLSEWPPGARQEVSGGWLRLTSTQGAIFATPLRVVTTTGDWERTWQRLRRRWWRHLADVAIASRASHDVPTSMPLADED